MQDNALAKNVNSFPAAFYDLSDSGINFDKFASFKVELTTVDGTHYGVHFDNVAAINAMRVDILEEAGYTIDDFTNITWEEFIEKGEKVREETGKPLISAIAGESDLLMLMMQSTGNWFFDQNGIVAGTMNGAWIIGSIVQKAEQAGDWRVTNLLRFADIEGATHYSNQGGSSWMVMANSEIAADFLNQTFARSNELYETILPSSGALATYLPAGDGEVYNKPHPFFGGQKIYTGITDYAANVPEVDYGIYNYEARDVVSTAITQIMSGSEIDKALDEAQSTFEFQMW